MYQYPDFLCLCAVYNHPQEWTENLIQMFLNQTYPGFAHLLIIDDRPKGLGSDRNYTLTGLDPNRAVSNVYIPTRCETLMHKYQYGLALELSADLANQFVCVMDDDDMYLPDFLTSHADAMGDSFLWSHPEKVASTAGDAVFVEETLGRFWACAAYRASALMQLGGFTLRREAAFDQMFLAEMRSFAGEPQRPKTVEYIYNTSLDIDHTSLYMRGQASTEWYSETPVAPCMGDYQPKLHERAIHFTDYYNQWVRKKYT